ncbi:MAG: hypothetical protein PGN15_15515 [Aeromicrobium erythreum]
MQENDQETIAFVDSLYERGYVPATEYSVYAFQGCEENQAYGVFFLTTKGTARAFDKADLSNTEQPPSDNPERSRFSVQSFR